MSYRSIDGLTIRPARIAVRGRAFTRGEATFEPKVSKDHLSGSTKGKGTLPRTAIRAGQPHKTWKDRLQLPLIIIGGMLAGFAIQNAALGQVLIILYGVVAVLYNIPSRASFIAALTAMLITIGFLVLKGDVVTSQTFAVYTFLFLVVGVITLNREVKREGGRIYSRR